MKTAQLWLVDMLADCSLRYTSHSSTFLPACLPNTNPACSWPACEAWFPDHLPAFRLWPRTIVPAFPLPTLPATDYPAASTPGKPTCFRPWWRDCLSLHTACVDNKEVLFHSIVSHLDPCQLSDTVPLWWDFWSWRTSLWFWMKLNPPSRVSSIFFIPITWITRNFTDWLICPVFRLFTQIPAFFH